MDDPRQALSEVSKEFVEIAVYGNRLRNLQQSLVPLGKSFAGRCGMCIHRRAVWRNKRSPLKRGRGWRLMIFCARRTRTIRMCSFDTRSGRSISPHP
jgi:hypothetical protein